MWSKVLIGILVVATLIFLLKWFERKNIYFPTREIVTTPEDVGLDYENVTLKTDDGIEIHGWLIPANSSKYLIFCHGNGGNISHRLESILTFNSISLNVLIFDYRSYGKSKGIATEEGTYRDALAAYNYLVDKKVKPENIIVFGRSLGGNIAIHLASIRDVGIVITEAAFTSTMDMAGDIYGFRVPEKVLSFKYNALRKIKEVSEPILIMHSRNDRMIPFEHGKILFESANEPKEFLELSGGHNYAFTENRELYRETIVDFINEYMKSDS